MGCRRNGIVFNKHPGKSSIPILEDVERQLDLAKPLNFPPHSGEGLTRLKLAYTGALIFDCVLLQLYAVPLRCALVALVDRFIHHG